MAFEFVENTTIELPDVSESVFNYSESAVAERHKLIIEMAAIHEGLTANYNFYSGEALAEAVTSWVSPYPKPILINHDTDVHPLGRVMAARMDKESDGTPFTRLQIAITDPEAIQRVLDQRYMTGSVGGSAKSAKCSICGTDWAESKGPGAPCKHQRGKVYNGKLACFELGGLGFREYSFVNVPADQRSMVLPSSGGTENEGWVRSAKIYSLDMNNESIMEFGENRGPINILEGMKKKDAHFTYTNLKGTWLSVSAIHDYQSDKIIENITNDVNITTMSNEASAETGVNVVDQTAEEKEMPEAIENEVEDLDIAAVVEQLSDDLATSSEVEEESTESSEVVESEDEVTEESEEVEEETAEVDSTEEVETEETATEEDQSDLDGSDASDSEAAEEEVQPVDEEATQEEQLSEETQETEESASVDTAELQAQYDRVVNENKQLKTIMHKMLAERVVDKKIDLGIVSATERAEALQDHIARSASSLADSLKDLHQFRPMPSLSTESLADLGNSTYRAYATGEEEIVDVTTDEKAPAKTAEEKAVDLFTDVLMGRRPAL